MTKLQPMVCACFTNTSILRTRDPNAKLLVFGRARVHRPEKKTNGGVFVRLGEDVWLSESTDPADMIQVAERLDHTGCRRGTVGVPNSVPNR